jgi:hypothetical protein
MLHEGTPGWSGRENLHSIKSYGHPLGVACECGRKLAIPLDRLGQLDGNMAPIKSLKLACRVCGSRNWKATLFVSAQEVEAFLDSANRRSD